MIPVRGANVSTAKWARDAKADEHALRYSEDFRDRVTLLAAAEQQAREGMTLTYQPSAQANPGWVKAKTATWRAANRDRWELF